MRYVRYAALVCLVALLPSPLFAQASDRRLDAIDRTTAWIEQHTADPRDPFIQRFVFDAWARHLVASQHPDRATRERVGHKLDDDLRLVRPTAPVDLVPITYWALLLAIMSQRGVAVATYVADVQTRVQLPALLASADRTTAYWTSALFRLSGVAIDPVPYFDRGWIAQSAMAEEATPYTPSLSDAYRVFHEIVPRTQLGTKPVDVSPAQRRFVRRTVPLLIEYCRTQNAVDGAAEVLVAAALLDLRSDQHYRPGVDFVLAHQQSDGTFADPSRQISTIDEQRHTVLTGLWALLTAVPK